MPSEGSRKHGWKVEVFCFFFLVQVKKKVQLQKFESYIYLGMQQPSILVIKYSIENFANENIQWFRCSQKCPIHQGLQYDAIVVY